MIGLLAAVLSAGACSGAPITLAQAKQLVLAAPNIRASVAERGAKPRFEWVDTKPNGWRFDVNSATPCLHYNACSTLLGHFWVTRLGEVEDLDGGKDGIAVSSPRMRRLVHTFREANCPTSASR